jgi:YesN/AraC family two-component response regulator
MNHYGNPNLDVDSISKGVAMSMARSESKFKLETGLTLIDYLNKHRIQKAMEMLENGEVKIYEISEKVGFASSQYFSKVFKKYTALTPIEYRKRLTDEIYEKHSF